MESLEERQKKLLKQVEDTERAIRRRENELAQLRDALQQSIGAYNEVNFQIQEATLKNPPMPKKLPTKKKK